MQLHTVRDIILVALKVLFLIVNIILNEFVYDVQKGNYFESFSEVFTFL